MKRRLDHCRQPGCALPIVWALTESGAAMPIDAEPHPDGNLAVRANHPTGQLQCRVITAEQPLDPHTELRGMPHWSTCRNPPRRRKP